MTELTVGSIGNRSYLAGEAINNIDGAVDLIYLEDPSLIDEKFDIVFALGWYKLIKSEILKKPRHGIFVSHAADLPKGRGWAPVNWALINQEPFIHITTFKVDEGCDTGPYYMKSKCPLTLSDTIFTAYRKVEYEIIKHLSSILSVLMRNQPLILHTQEGSPSWNPRRRPRDSQLDPELTLRELWPLIRACHNDDYPAFFLVGDKKVILRHEIIDG